ncbi:MAG: hypothetical protein ACOVNV_08265 [Pirellulaceae bacterium]
MAARRVFQQRIMVGYGVGGWGVDSVETAGQWLRQNPTGDRFLIIATLPPSATP